MEKNSTTIILICAIIFIISAFAVIFFKIIPAPQNAESETIQQSMTTQTDKIQNNKVNKHKVPNANKIDGISILTSINAIFLVTLLVSGLLFIIIPIISYWKIYSNNGENGFASIIPIYSQMVLYRIVGLNEMYVLFVFIPLIGTLVSAIINLYATYLLAQKYEKGVLFVVGLIVLPYIFLPILAFSKVPQKIDAFYENY